LRRTSISSLAEGGSSTFQRRVLAGPSCCATGAGWADSTSAGTGAAPAWATGAGSTGAAAAGGFKGLGGQYGRRNLLSFGVHGVAGIRLTRRDTGVAVDCVTRLHKVAGDPRLGELLPNVILGTASAAESQLFRELWQDRVERILNADPNGIVEVFRVNRP